MVSSEFEVGPELEWPPSNWRKMGPDQKLMARVFAAMFLEKKSNRDFP